MSGHILKFFFIFYLSSKRRQIKSQNISRVNIIYPEGNMKVGTEVHCNSSNSCNESYNLTLLLIIIIRFKWGWDTGGSGMLSGEMLFSY